MSNQTKIIVAVLVLLVLAGIGYITFFNNSSDTTALSTGGQTASAAEVTFLNLASEINPITFDTSIFSDPRFAGLINLHTAVIPEPEGRVDPFASI